MAHKRISRIELLAIVTILAPLLAAAQASSASPWSAAPATSTQNNTASNKLTNLSFLPAMTYNSGGRYAAFVAAADLNADGNLDLVVMNIFNESQSEATSFVGVLLGRSDGTFQPVVTYDSGGEWAQSVSTVADVNGDGKPDLVVANWWGSASCPDGALDILLGNGDGTFQPAVEHCSGGSTPLAVAVADVNGDGIPDLIAANANSNNIGVLLGKGDGTFQPALTYDSGYPGPASVVVADVNGDHRLDLVVADAQVSPGALSVLLGNGNGTFQPAVIEPSSGYSSIAVAVADVNGDGFLDLLAANGLACNTCKNGSVGVLMGNGDGTFQPAVAYSTGGNAAMSLAVADVNGDGKLDLVAANYASDNLAVLLGNGDGTFLPALTYASGGSGPVSVAVADVNRDAKPDLLTVNWYGNGNDLGLVGVLLNNTPFCTTPPTVTLSVTPTSLWPPNGKMVPVRVSGTITDTGCTIETAAYAVTDEYGLVQPSGPVTLGPGGAYSFSVLLQASRLGTDRDGRLYTLSVSAINNGGTTGSQSGTVVVPHDQGH